MHWLLLRVESRGPNHHKYFDLIIQVKAGILHI